METITTTTPPAPTASQVPHNADGNRGDAHAELISVSPTIAARWLERNESNRGVREGRVNGLAEAMRRGEFVITGDTIKFAPDGRLLDGQHRLWAVLESGVTVQMLVAYNIAPEAQTVMDSGAARTFADTLKWKGEKNYTIMAGALRILTGFYRTGKVVTGQYQVIATPGQMLAFLDDHPSVRDHVYTPHHETTKRMLTPSTAAALYYLFAQVDRSDAESFFTLLATGSGLREGHPIFTLRRALEINANRRTAKVSSTFRCAWTIKAWNAWRRGERVFQIRWVPGGANPEVFPAIDGFDYTQISRDDV